MHFAADRGAGAGGPPRSGQARSSSQRQMMRPDQHVPILMLLDNEGERRLDRPFERLGDRGIDGLPGIDRRDRADPIDGSLQIGGQALGARAETVRLGLRQGAVQGRPECGEERRDQREPQGVEHEMRQRAESGQAEKPGVQTVHPPLQRLLAECNPMMVAALSVEHRDGPARVA